MTARIVTVPCLRDNYAYLVICERTGQAAVIDPGEAAPVLQAVADNGVELVAVWATHHHADHVGALPALLQRGPLEVVCHYEDTARVVGASRLVGDADEVGVGDVRATIVHNPGHTRGAISYYLPAESMLFTGDTWFGAGCGRIFEGTAEQMFASLQLLVSLNAEHIYVGHEYTAANLRFAQTVEPTNAALVERLEAAIGAVTVPTSTRLERATNPFLRCHVPEIQAAVELRGAPAPAVFAALRAAKDRH